MCIEVSEILVVVKPGAFQIVAVQSFEDVAPFLVLDSVAQPETSDAFVLV